MLYYKNSFNKVNTDSYALYFNGVNQYLLNDVGTPFIQPQPLQNFTFCTILETLTVSGVSTIISSNNLLIRFVNSTTIDFLIGETTGGFNRFYARFTSVVVTSEMDIRIVYAGTFASIKLYINGIENTNKTNIGGTLTSVLFSTSNLEICKQLSNTRYLNTTMREISILDFVQNQSEIDASVLAKTQIKGSGNFLFNLPLIYITNGTGNIATLDSTISILETVQNLDINFINYPNPLILDTNLIKI